MYSSGPTYFLSAEEGVGVLVSKLLLVLKRVSCSARLFLGSAAIPLSLGAPFQFGCQPIVQSKCFEILHAFYAHTGIRMCMANMVWRITTWLINYVTCVYWLSDSTKTELVMAGQQNEPSTLLSQEENDLVFTIIGHRKLVETCS